MPPSKPLVLIADDERNAVILLTRILERDGFAVDSAKDGETALEKASTLHPDLILLDVQMPRLNGFEVTQRLRDNPETSRIPVIFVTAAARDPSDVVHGLKLGADDYVRKPYDYHELLARAHSKMRARQLEDRLQRRGAELEALVRIGGEFNQRLGLEELTEYILNVVSQEFDTQQVELFLFGDQKNVLLYRNLADPKKGLPAATKSLKENPILEEVFRSTEPTLLVANETGEELSPALAAPLKHHGQLLGILSVIHDNPERYGEADLRLLRSIGEQAALAVRNAQLYAELQSYAQNLEEMVETRTQELRAAQEQLVRNEKLAALGRLAAGVAHEVNNPLQPILNCLEVAVEDIENNQPVDVEVLRVAEKEVQRIKSIVARLLDFARPSTTDKTEYDLADLVREVLTLARKQLERMHVQIHTKLSPVSPLTGTPAQLKQVFLNLVINAMEAMPEGGDLTVEVFEEDGGAKVVIADTGMGMDSHTVERIFEPFYSTKEDGTGLGLAVSYGIIQGHGGEIRADSKPNKGTRFTVWLPY
jgi:signal transduction histidine kinase